MTFFLSTAAFDASTDEVSCTSLRQRMRSLCRNQKRRQSHRQDLALLPQAFSSFDLLLLLLLLRFFCTFISRGTCTSSFWLYCCCDFILNTTLHRVRIQLLFRIFCMLFILISRFLFVAFFFTIRTDVFFLLTRDRARSRALVVPWPLIGAQSLLDLFTFRFFFCAFLSFSFSEASFCSASISSIFSARDFPEIAASSSSLMSKLES